MTMLYFNLPYLHVLNSALVLSLYIDVILTLSIINCLQTTHKLYLHNPTSMRNSKWLSFEPIRRQVHMGHGILSIRRDMILFVILHDYPVELKGNDNTACNVYKMRTCWNVTISLVLLTKYQSRLLIYASYTVCIYILILYKIWFVIFNQISRTGISLYITHDVCIYNATAYLHTCKWLEIICWTNESPFCIWIR